MGLATELGRPSKRLRVTRRRARAAGRGVNQTNLPALLRSLATGVGGRTATDLLP
jgi:hypothetical protein